jgi:hypothetical protein
MIGLEAEDPSVVGQRVFALGCAGQEPGIATGAREPVTDARGQRAAEPGRRLVATA